MIGDYNQYVMGYKEWLSIAIIGFIVLFLGSYLFYKNIIISIVGGACIIFLKKEIEKILANKRKELLKYQFRDLLYSISSSMATGRHMGEALLEAEESMKAIYKENSPILLELKYMVKEIYESKEREEIVLISLANRSHIEDIENFARAYEICKITGGDVERMISKTTEILIDKISIEREIKAMAAQKKFEGKIIGSMPFIVLGFLNITSPDYMEPMYELAMGRIIMTVALVGIIIAWKLTIKITDIET